MATRRRSTRSSSTGRARSSGYRTGYRNGYRTYRRRPRTATTLGGAAALGLVALVTRLSWFWRIGIVAVVVLLAAVYFIWSRRHAIAEEMQVQRDAPTDPPPG